MKKEMFGSKWQQFKEKIREKWNKLTEQDLEQVSGKREGLLEKLRSRYGYTEEKAEQELMAFEKKCGCKCACKECGEESCCCGGSSKGACSSCGSTCCSCDHKKKKY